MQSKLIGRHSVPRVVQRTSAKCASLVLSHQVVVGQVVTWQLVFQIDIFVCGVFSKRESVLFFLPFLMSHSQGCEQNRTFWHLGVICTVL